MDWSWGKYLGVMQETLRTIGMVLGEVAKLKGQLDEVRSQLPQVEAVAATRGGGPDTLEMARMKLDGLRRKLEEEGEAEKRGTPSDG